MAKHILLGHVSKDIVQKKSATKLTAGAKFPPRDICCTQRANWKKLPETGDPPLPSPQNTSR